MEDIPPVPPPPSTTPPPESVPPPPASVPAPAPATVAPPAPKPHGKKLLWLVLVLGLVAILGGIGFAIWNMQSANVPYQQPPLTVETMPTVEPTVDALPLSLSNPIDGGTAIEEEILVSGNTLPNITVSVVTDTDDELVESDAMGNFEATITLAPGSNTLVVTAYSDQEEKSVSMEIVYEPTTE